MVQAEFSDAQALRVYTDIPSVARADRKHRCPLLDHHFANLDSSAILAGRHAPASPLKVVPDPAGADWFVLPMHWTCYLWKGKARMKEAEALAALADAHGKPLIVWFKGDLEPVVPFANAVVFLPGMVGSHARSSQRACPVFIDDPAPHLAAGTISCRERRDKPTVGFCGYAEMGSAKLIWSVLQGVQQRALAAIGRSDHRRAPIVPATLTRARALRILSESSAVESRFVMLNQHFRAGPTDAFFANITDSDYTVCVRGFGNWSYRFYQTLACGRIPVFVNTDCVLPNSSKIEWQRYCVWVDSSELTFIAEKLADFHSDLSPSDFVERQVACRILWEEQLTLSGFMNHIRDYL